MAHLFRFLSKADAPAPASIVGYDVFMPIHINRQVIVIMAYAVSALLGILGLVVAARCTWHHLSSLWQWQLLESILEEENKGLDQNILRSLPKVTFTEELAAAYSECAVCLAEFSSEEEVRVLPHCEHAFHVECVDTWLGSQSTCPTCRLTVSSCPNNCDKCGNNLQQSSCIASSSCQLPASEQLPTSDF